MNSLNIYAGVKAIGWNITNDSKVIDFGVKKTNVDFTSYYEFMSGNPVSKRIIRREKRQARRNLQRRKFQRNKLLYELKKEFHLKPNLNLSQSELLELRIKAHSEILSIQDLVTVIYSFTKKRGYKSQRGVDEVGASDYLAEIKRHEDELVNYPNLSKYLLELKNLKNVVIRRETYENEFKQIADFQKINHDKYHKLIFFQRPLKKGKVNNCKLETNRKVTHASNPLYEKMRIYRDAWNVKITNKLLEEIEISFEVRKKIIENLMSGKDITKAKVCQMLGLQKSSQFNWLSGKKIEGNFWRKITERDLDLYQLWQDLRGIADDEYRTKILVEKYNFNDLELENVEKYDVAKKNFSEFSQKAIRKLLPLLEIMPLKEAILQKYGKMEQSDNIYLRNLIVEQVYSSTKSLIEAANKKYKIDEVKIELQDELKISNKARKEKRKRERLQEKELKEIHEEIKNYCNVSDYNVRKYKLAKEQEFKDLYSGKEIDLKELFTNKYNLDHIIPKSMYFDFSNKNLVVTEKNNNSNKLRQTAIDFMQGDKNYLKRIEETKLPEYKKRLLLTSEKDIPNVFSFSVDYNTRCFLSLHKNSTNIPNKLIHFYSKQWNLNQYNQDDIRYFLEKSFVVANLSAETIKYINDIRFHSADKTSVAAYDINLTFQIPKFDNVLPYIPTLKYYHKKGNNIIIRNQLHEETVYGKRKEIIGRDMYGKNIVKEFYKVRKPISSLTNAMVSKITDKAVKKFITSKIKEFGSLEKLQESLSNNELIFNCKPIKSVSIEINSTILTKIPTGYVHASTFGITKEGIFLNIFDGLKLFKENISLSEIFQKNNIVSYNNEYYYVYGISNAGLSMRSIYDLTAQDKGIKIGLKKVKELKKITKTQI